MEVEPDLPVEGEEDAPIVNPYEGDERKINEFLLRFDDDKYMSQLEDVALGKSRLVTVNVEDFENYYRDDRASSFLVDKIKANAMMYHAVFCDAADMIMREQFADEVIFDQSNVVDVMNMFRSQHNTEDMYPPALIRRYQLIFVLSEEDPPLFLRKIRAGHIGKLIKTRGIVVRASELMPLCQVATYVCDNCGCEIYLEVFT